MRWPRIVLLVVLALLIGGFLHYTLPQRDVVRITGTDVIRQDFSAWNRIFYASPDDGAQPGQSRDIRFINTVLAGGGVMVYRNEDTGFGWPPYFKIDTADLQAEATNLISTEAAPRWVVVTHYGWRLHFPTAYPNAVSIREVDGPDVSLFPWLNIVILSLIALALWAIWRIWERFEARVIDPATDRLAVRWAKLRDRLAGRR